MNDSVLIAVMKGCVVDGDGERISLQEALKQSQ